MNTPPTQPPQLVVEYIVPTSTYEQSGYRLYTGIGSTDVGTPLAAADTSAGLAGDGDIFRLRMLTHVSSANLPQSAQSYKLQFVGKGAGTCAAPTGGTPATWTDVESGTITQESSGPSSPGVITTASSGDNVLWSNPERIGVSDDNRASVSLATSAFTDYLIATGFVDSQFRLAPR